MDVANRPPSGWRRGSCPDFLQSHSWQLAEAAAAALGDHHHHIVRDRARTRFNILPAITRYWFCHWGCIGSLRRGIGAFRGAEYLVFMADPGWDPGPGGLGL